MSSRADDFAYAGTFEQSLLQPDFSTCFGVIEDEV